MPRYRMLEHTADLGVYFYGETPEKLFENAATSLFAIMLEKPPLKGDRRHRISASGNDMSEVLIYLLGELLYLFQVKGLCVTKAEISSVSDTTATADLELAEFDFDVHGIETEIKAATYHQLELKPWNKGWRAKVIFDL